MWMCSLGINRENTNFHNKTKIKFIFLAELTTLILDKNVLFYERVNFLLQNFPLLYYSL